MTATVATLVPQDEREAIGLIAQLATTRDPELVLADARKCATALQDVISKKPDPVTMNGKQYLEFEDWQTVGNFYQCVCRTISTTFVQYGEVQGFESTSEVVHVPTGAIVSRADAMCLNDEPKWRAKAKYEWKTVNGERTRIQVGEEPVPLFQLRSMSQTRSGAKALRQAFAWVVVLAGYKATPAEELDGLLDDRGAAGAAKTSKHAEASFSTEPNGDKVNTGTGEVVDEGRPTFASEAGQAAASSGSTSSTSAPATGLNDGERLIHVTRVVELKRGNNARGEWVMFGVETTELGAEKYLSTFDKSLAVIAATAKKDGKPCAAKWSTETKGRFTNHELKAIRVVEAPATENREPGQEG